MDKIRLSLSGSGGDFVRLYNWNQGFRADRASISFPSGKMLTLFLISVRQYELNIEGDAKLTRADDVGDEFMRFYHVNWSEEAKQHGSGSATLKIVNPDFPNEPFVISLTMADFSYDHPTAQTSTGPVEMSAANRLGAQMMMLQETIHADIADMVPTKFWGSAEN
jgi:hypothetical protein